MSTSVTETQRAVATHRWVVDPSQSTVEFRVKTFWGLRIVAGQHLRGTDFFHVEQHPHVRFTSAHVSDLGNGKLWVEGELEAAGKRVPVSFEASRRDVGDDIELEATTTIDQRLLGMTTARSAHCARRPEWRRR